jgi:GT2 family glycosyltransferase
VEAIRAAYPEARIISLSRNLGYAGNNNVGIQAALELGADWVLVLNEDVVLAPEALTRLVAVAESDPRIGIVGPLVYHHDEPTVIQSAGGFLTPQWLSYHRAQNEPDAGHFTRPQPVDWISGCAILVRRQVIEQVGALDDRFFYYWEETEWCLRARRAGWQVMFAPQAKLWHKGVQRDYRPGPNITYYWIRNWLMLLSKHRAPVRAWAYALAWIVRNSLAWTFNPKWRSMREHRAALWQGVADFARRRWGMRPALTPQPKKA